MKSQKDIGQKSVGKRYVCTYIVGLIMCYQNVLLLCCLVFLSMCFFCTHNFVQSKSKLSGEAECQIVKKAVLFGQELGIPEEFAFSGGDLAEVVIKLCNDCHFKRLRFILSCLMLAIWYALLTFVVVFPLQHVGVLL